VSLVKKRHKLFDRFGISFMPANGEGVVVFVAAIGFIALLIGAGWLLGRAIDSAIPEYVFGLLALVFFLTFLRFAYRHSE
jgi:hypothetical protein